MNSFGQVFFYPSCIEKKWHCISSSCLSSFFPVTQCARICVVFVLTGCPVLKLIGDINVTECHQHKNQPSVLESRHSMAHICYGRGANLMWCMSPPLKGHVIPHDVWQETEYTKTKCTQRWNTSSCRRNTEALYYELPSFSSLYCKLNA